MSIEFDIKTQLKLLPDSPGVYLMRNFEDQVIYVGKAKVLKNRVRQYFQNSNRLDLKTKAMVEKIVRFEYIITDSEYEALILECNLIKEYNPRYNIIFRDDKTYPFIKITIQEEYPRILKVRMVKKDKNLYFGPYTNEMAVNAFIETIRKYYPLRKCNKNINFLKEKKERPCLNFFINNCLGPCQQEDKKEEYKNMVQEIILFLSGKDETLLKELEEKMNLKSKNMEFEEAAVLRDKIIGLKSLLEKQKIVSKSLDDKDLIDIYFGENQKACLQIFFIRKGKIVGREYFILEDTIEDDYDEAITSFITQFYSRGVLIPSQIFLRREINQKDFLERWLFEEKMSKVQIKNPKKGDSFKLLEMVLKNAKESLEKYGDLENKKLKSNKELLLELSNMLSIDKSLDRIESYDISNIQGVDSIGVMVVYENARKNPKEYRRFKIKQVEGIDDYASTREIIQRRLKAWPKRADLILLDGGVGHVQTIKKLLEEENENIPIWGMVKDEKHRTNALTNGEKTIILDKKQPLYRFVAQIQEEVHRFAIDYHRSLRSQGMKQSILDNINGIGKLKKKNLLKYFSSIEDIKKADVEKLKKVDKISEKDANEIIKFFKNIPK